MCKRINKADMKEKIKRVDERVTHRANEKVDMASRFAALNSYIQRKMQPNEAEWCAKWIYEIMDTLDYVLRCQENECEIFREIYGVDIFDLRFWCDCDYRMGEIKEIMEAFDRAVATYGEVKLSVGQLIEKPYSIKYEREADRAHNMQIVKEYKEAQS